MARAINTRTSRLAGVLSAAVVLSGLAGCSGAQSPTAAATSASPSPSITAACIYSGNALAKRVVHFRRADGNGTVEAYVRSPAPATASPGPAGSATVGIVVDHESGQTLCDSMGWADQFAAEGYRAIAPTLDDTNQVTETEGAVAYLRAHGATRIVLLGASMGGTTVLQTAAELQPPVQAVISVSGPESYYPLDASAAAAKLAVPVFYSAGAGDTGFAAAETNLYDATLEKDKVLDIVPGTDLHGFDLLGTLLTKVNAFIQSHTR